MDIHQVFGTDRSKETEGVWVSVGEGGEVKVARTNNPRYKEAFRRKLEKYRASVERGTIDEETAQKVLVEVLAETILLDWKGFKDNGEKVPYSREKAVELLTNYPDFRDFITANAERMANYKQEQKVDEEKNSKGPSLGISGGESKKAS